MSINPVIVCDFSSLFLENNLLKKINFLVVLSVDMAEVDIPKGGL